MDPTLVPDTWFESQFQICVYEHAILRIYISFFYQSVPTNIKGVSKNMYPCLELSYEYLESNEA